MTAPEMGVMPGHVAELADIMLLKRVGECLDRHYPGHPWYVDLDSDPNGGVVRIRHMGMSSRWGYVLHMATVQNDPGLRCVMRAAGEILERGGLARSMAKAGEEVKRIEGVRAKDQPFHGIII